MAEIVWFKGIVKGQEKNCEKLLEIFPCYEIEDTKDLGTLEKAVIAFCGTCANGVCAYAKNKKPVEKLTEAKLKRVDNNSTDKYTKFRLQDLAILFDVEIMINSVGEDSGEKNNFEHYDKDTKIDDECPKELLISAKEIDSELSLDDIEVPEPKQDSIIKDREEAIRILSASAKNLRFLSEELRNDAEIVNIALGENTECAKYVGAELMSDKDFVMGLVMTSWNASVFKYASKSLRGDKEFVKKVLRKNGRALEYASEEIKNDPKIALTIIQDYQNPEDENLYGKELLKNKEFAIDAIKITRGFYYYYLMDDSLRNDRDLSLLAIEKWKQNIIAIGEPLFEDKGFVLKVLELVKGKQTLEEIVDRLSDELKEDKDVLDLIKRKQEIIFKEPDEGYRKCEMCGCEYPEDEGVLIDTGETWFCQDCYNDTFGEI